jgi:hypothetical protein
MAIQWSPVLACVLWLGVVGFGFHLAATYQSRPGQPALPAEAWPSGAPIARDALLPTLVLAVHPHCPCTRATLRELDRLAARCRGRARMHVLFYADPERGSEWVQSDLWDHARSIPGVEVTADPRAENAALFGARTSGQVFLFDPQGRLLFEGGITAARGHEGESEGARAVADLLTTGSARVEHAPVFGCALVREPGAGE